jgi:RND family efflux transporter MFP subunit
MSARLLCLLLPLFVLATGAAGSDDRPAGQPPEVEVVQPATREVADYEDFIGRTEASETVRICARVSGYLTKVHFKDGAEVKKGDLLFEIDPRPYKAELDRAEAAVVLSQAVLARVEAEYKRARTLFDRKAIGKEELDKATAAKEEAQARVAVHKAARQVYQLNLDFTRVTAPISGRIDRRRLDAGNLVKVDETHLATIVYSKPMYVYFEVDERVVLRLRRMALQGKGKEPRVGIQLADENDFSRRAAVDFIDNSLNPKTGTLRLRVTLPNADGLLMPGLFARVRLTGKPYKALLVPQQSVELNLNKIGRTSVPGAGFVLVVTEKNEVKVREVRLGQRHGDLVVVKEGLRADDRVVLKGPEGLKDGMAVRPKKVAVPGGKRAP